MAVLVFLARSARARRVARYAAPGIGVVRVDLAGGLTAVERGNGITLAALLATRVAVTCLQGGIGAGFVHFLIRALEVIFVRGRLELHLRQHGGDTVAQTFEHFLEQVEGFPLVFVERVALRISPEPDPLTQMVEGQQVLFPALIQQLQQKALFHHAHDVGADVGGLFGHHAVGDVGQAFADFLIGDAFFLGPFLDRQTDAEDTQHFLVQEIDVPLIGIGFFGNRRGDHVIDNLPAHVDDVVGDLFGGHQLAALFIDHLALVIHHVIELEQVLADFEVPRLDLRLRLFERLVDPRVHDRLALLEAELLQHAVDPLGTEDAHQIVLQGQIELRRPRVALTAGTTAQLVVDTAAFMTFGAEHEQPAGLQNDVTVALDFFFDLGRRGFVFVGAGFGIDVLRQAHFQVAAQLNVGAAARHIGGDRHAAGPAGLGDDKRFLLVVAGIEHVVRNFRALQRGGELFRFFDGNRPHQHRLLAFMAILDLLDDGGVFLVNGAVHFVIVVDARDLHVGRNFNDLELVNLGEFAGFRHRRAGHAGQLRIGAEVVLERDRGQGLVLVLDGDVFLGFKRLVQPFGIPPAFLHAAREFIDDDDVVVLDDVIHILFEQNMRAQRLVGVMHQIDILDIEQRAFLEKPGVAHQGFHVFDAAFGEGRRAGLLVFFVIVFGKLRDQLVDRGVKIAEVFRRAGNNQRRACLVDQDAVDFIDDGVIERPLHHVVEREFHVVAQIIETELVVGRIGHVAGISVAALIIVHAVLDDTDA